MKRQMAGIALYLLSSCTAAPETDHAADNTCDASSLMDGDRLEIHATFYCSSLTSGVTFRAWSYDDGPISWDMVSAGCYQDAAASLAMPSKHGAILVDVMAMVGSRQIRCTADL